MKLFLTSLWLLPVFREAFAELVGKPLDQIRVALIENGADDEPGEEPRWVTKARASLTDASIAVTQVDLRKYLKRTHYDELQKLLSSHDVIWVGGGNTFYVPWILKDSGADRIIAELVRTGAVYAGGSAGSMVAGPTLHGFEDVGDDISFAPEVVLDGLHLTDIITVPHWGRNDYGEVMHKINDQLKAAGYRTQPLTDKQALMINGSEVRVLP